MEDLLESNIYTKEEVIEDIVNKEKANDVYDVLFGVVPIYRLIRFRLINIFLKKEFNIDPSKTKSTKISFLIIIKNVFISLFHLLGIKKYKNKKIAVFAFPRLTKVDDIFIDKISDPVIDLLSLKGDSFIFQRHNNGFHKSKRLNKDLIVFTDFLDYVSLFIGYFISIWALFKYKIDIKLVKAKLNIVYDDKIVSKYHIAYSYSVFKVKTKFYEILFNYLKVEKLIVVDREIFLPQIFAAKRKKILVYELQHGVTEGITLLYSTQFDNRIDPDFMVVYSKPFVSNHFGIPKSKIINIGWPLKEYILKKNKQLDTINNSVCIISQPRYTDEIVDLATHIKINTINLQVFIRLHPQEGLSLESLEKLKTLNINIDDNEIESIVSISRFKYIMGVRSTVLFDATEMGRKVGLLNYGKFLKKDVRKNECEYQINSRDEALKFLDLENHSCDSTVGLYDDFNFNFKF